MKSIRSEWINARGRNAAGFFFGGGLGRVERVEGRNKLGDGPFKPLILLAIAGSVPKILILLAIAGPVPKIPKILPPAT